jgi:MFS transporter, DHA1 family, tetracycline resistance protein
MEANSAQARSDFMRAAVIRYAALPRKRVNLDALPAPQIGCADVVEFTGVGPRFMKRPSLLVIFLTVFIDLIGFGIVMPLLPIYTKQFGAPGYLIGLIMASFSVMQFLFAPVWGSLSDRIGRRPVLLLSTAGSVIAYSMFAIASTKSGQAALGLILFSRIFAGLCGANISVATAYIADITPQEKRSRSMGLIGMAFGLGFVFGPAFGSFSARAWGNAGPGWAAAAVCAANFLLALAVLRESRQPNSEPAVRRPRFNQWAHTLRQPTVGFLVILYFLAVFCFASFETTFGLLLAPLQYDQQHIGYFITFCGVVTALVQGVIGRLVKMFGERRLIGVSLVFAGIGLAILPFVKSLPGILFGLAVLALGSGINRPPTLGLISILTPPNEQGATLGVTQSAGSLARILAPLFAATLFDFSPALPYMICAVIAAAIGLFAWAHLTRPQAQT